MVSANAQDVTFSTKTPEAGKPFSLTYNPVGGSLEKLDKIECKAYTFVNNRQKVVAIPLTQEGGKYKGSFTPVDSTAIAVFVFSAGEERDQNPKGYYTLFHKNGVPTAMAHYWDAQFYNGMGKSFAGVDVDRPKAVVAFEKAFAADPKLKETYGNSYYNLQYTVDKVNGEKLIREEIARINASPSKAESSFSRIAGLYSTLKLKNSADSVNTLIKTQYPKGAYMYNLAVNAIYSEKDPAKKEEKLKALITDFNLDLTKEADKAKLVNLYSTIASAYGNAKNNAKFEEYAMKVENKMSLASLFNNFASQSAVKNDNLEFATKISRMSVDLINAAKLDPMPDYYASQEDFIKGMDRSYAMYATTYAKLLTQAGRDKEALEYQELAVKKMDFKNADMNSAYVALLAKAKQHDKVLTFAEKFVKDGQGTDQMKADLKAAYKGTKPFDAYYGELEREALEKERAKFMKEMISRPAPTFSLANLKGETVSLASLKGKVVIIDYWATWCGPCISSFPGMQKAVDKYKNDPNVAFVFVNTWQNEPDRDKLVKDWAAANPQYTFNILMDTKNAKDPSKFDVIEQYGVEGIPTKFIVDGNGNIRFKKVGFGGSADGTVKELDIMIGLAKGSKEASK